MLSSPVDVRFRELQKIVRGLEDLEHKLFKCDASSNASIMGIGSEQFALSGYDGCPNGRSISLREWDKATSRK